MKNAWKTAMSVALLSIILAISTTACQKGTSVLNVPETQQDISENSECVTEEEELREDDSTESDEDGAVESNGISDKTDSDTGKGDADRTDVNTDGDGVQSDDAKPDDATAEGEKNVNDADPAKSSMLATPQNSGALQVIGTQLCDKNGKPVQLRGISTHGLAWFPDYVNNSLFKQFREEWNVNVMRLAMYTHEYGGYCSGGDQEELKKLVKKGVKYATDNDMYVIIDWHVLNEQNPNTYKEDAKAFFKEMSKEFADSDNVLYEICNEPNGGTSWSDIKEYANEIIPIIRENNSDAVIIVGTPNWSQYVDQAASDPIAGYDNIMYALHFYAATHKQWLRDTLTAAIENGLPIFVTEYGICDASGSGSIDETEANNWVNTMDQYDVSYVAWNLSNKDETSSIIRSSCNKTSGLEISDLSDSGKWLYHLLTGESNHNDAEKTEKENSDSQQVNASQDNTDSSEKKDEPGNSQELIASITTNAEMKVTATVTNCWEADGSTCYQYTLEIKNVSGEKIENWDMEIKFNEDITLQSGWNGNMSVDGTTLRIEAMDYNGAIEPEGSVTDIGFIVCT